MKTKDPNEVIERLSKQHGGWVSDMIPDEYRKNPVFMDLLERIFDLPKEERNEASRLIGLIRESYFKPADAENLGSGARRSEDF